jgi:hypothetical protein
LTSVTLARAIERIIAGEEAEGPLSDFVESFFALETNEERLALIAEEPPSTGQRRLDALAGALGEYMAKHFCRVNAPRWTIGPSRYLEHAWHVLIFNDGRSRPVLSTDAGLREFLTFSSPAEFKSRNIFTEATPLPQRFYNRPEPEPRLQ